VSFRVGLVRSSRNPIIPAQKALSSHLHADSHLTDRSVHGSRFSLSYRDIEELLVERGVAVDHVTVYRWVQRFTPLLADAARFARHSLGDRWHVDETYVKVGGVWRYVYRAVDQHGQVIDVLVSARRNGDAARRFFQRALATLKVKPTEVVTDAAPVYPAVLDELIPSAWHHVERYAKIRSRLTIVGSSTGSDRCADYERQDRSSDHRRTCLHTQPPTRPLRTHHRDPDRQQGGRRVHRTRPSDLTTGCSHGSPCPPIPQRNGTGQRLRQVAQAVVDGADVGECGRFADPVTDLTHDGKGLRGEGVD